MARGLLKPTGPQLNEAAAACHAYWDAYRCRWHTGAVDRGFLKPAGLQLIEAAAAVPLGRACGLLKLRAGRHISRLIEAVRTPVDAWASGAALAAAAPAVSV